MRGVLELTFAGYGDVSESEKAFLHARHRQMACEETTKHFEKSSFYADPKKRTAAATRHWNTYPAKNGAAPNAAIRSLESTLGSAQ